MDSLACLVGVILAIVPLGEGLMFQLPANQKKCLKEEIHKDMLVKGEYELSEAPNQFATLRVLLHALFFINDRPIRSSPS